MDLVSRIREKDVHPLNEMLPKISRYLVQGPLGKVTNSLLELRKESNSRDLTTHQGLLARWYSDRTRRSRLKRRWEYNLGLGWTLEFNW